MKIVLTGFRGTGKTVVGKVLAERNGLPFIDTDETIALREKRPVAQIFSEEGERYFRKVEQDVIQSLRDAEGVISTGGGAVLDSENVAALKADAIVLLLQSDPKTILARIQQSERPSLTDLSLEEEVLHLLRVRWPFYLRSADSCVDTRKKSVIQIVQELETLLATGFFSPDCREEVQSFFSLLPLTGLERECVDSILTGSAEQRLKQLCAVVGFPASHSRSPELFHHLFQAYCLRYHYTRIEWPRINPVIELARKGAFRGLSVTLPFKEVVVPFLDEVEDAVRAIGAANTVIQCGGTLYGHNTDWIGIRHPLKALRGARAVVLGAGGAAAAAVYACEDLDMQVTVLNRTVARGRALAERFGASWGDLSDLSRISADVVIHATPVGMSGDPNLPVPVRDLRPSMTVFDLVYTPRNTPLLKAAREQGCTTIPGTEMFIHQAREQFTLFTGIIPAENLVRNVIL